MVAVALVQGNLAVEIGERLADGAPADFFIDIQPDQLAGFERIVARSPAPASSRCRCCAAASRGSNGVPVEQAAVAAEAQWALRNDRGLTYAALPPQGVAHRRRRMVAAGLPRPAADFVRRRAGAAAWGSRSATR